MKSLKINSSIAILLFINFIFCFKYSSRYSEFGFHIATILLVIQFLVFKYGNKISLSNKLKKIICFCFLFFLVSLVIISHFAISLESLNVDRWSVISSFLTELYNGNYPYYAKSHMGNFPGPMPIYFLIAAPFHEIGELSILSSLGYLIITTLFIIKIEKIENIKFLLFYFFTSLFIIWEITTRSNVFTYSFFTLLVLNEFISLDNKNNLKFYGIAVLTGLILSTRSVYILPYIIFFLSSLINKEVAFERLFFFVSFASLAFLSTFIPFIWVFQIDFFTMNPFIIQSSFLVPKFYTLLFILISIILALLVKNKTDKFFYSGISLFVSILIYSIYYIVNYGIESSFFSSKIDISYFIFCVPFLIKYLMDNSNGPEKLAIANNV